MPTIAACFPPILSGFFLICESATPPRTMARIAGTGPRQSHPTVILIMPITIAAVASDLLCCWLYAGGGGGCHAGVGAGCHCGGEALTFAGGFQLAGSLGREAD